MNVPKPRVLALAGSLRTGSFNRKLLAVGIRELERLGAEVDVADLKVLALPVYDGDLEAERGLPPPAVELRERIARAQGILISSPEYNHSIPGGLKNAMDWVSRPPHQPLQDKVAALVGASTGSFGTVRAQAHLRQTLTALGVWLVPGQVLLPRAGEAFSEQGTLKDPERAKEMGALMVQLMRALQKPLVV